MAVIGNSSTQQAFTPAVDYFSGNASTTAFTLSRPVASVAQVQVTVNNVAQNPSSAYTISSNTITFTSAPSSGTNNIYVYYTSPITQVIAPGQGTVNTTALGNITNIASGNSSLTLQTGSGNTTAVTVDTSQNVGVGVSSPSYKLDVYSGSSGAVAQISGPNAYNAESGILLSSSRAKISGFLNGSGGTPGASLRFYTMPDGGSITERMRIYSDGYVTFPSQVAVETTRQSNFAVTSNEGVQTVVPFDSETLDVGNNFSTSTYRFTAPVAGKYEFHWSYACNTSSNTVYRTYLWINGTRREDSQLRNDNLKTGSAYTWGSRSLILSLSANDYVELRASSDNGTDFYADTNLRVSMGISLIS